MLDLVFPLGCLTSCEAFFMVDEFDGSPIFGVLGSLFVISIVFDNTSLYISCDASIEGIVSTSDDIGRVGHRVTIRKGEKIAKKH